jgi:hypothetical protein
MIDAIFSDRTQRRCARAGLVGGAIIPIAFSVAVLVTDEHDAYAQSQADVERAQCLFLGVYVLEFFALAGLLWYSVLHSRPARQAAACAVIFATCHVGSTYAAMMVARPVVFVLGNLWAWLFGFA